MVHLLQALVLRRGVPVVALEEQVIRRRGPVHLEDLWSRVTMTYEPDVGWVLNNEHLEPRLLAPGKWPS